MKGGLGGRECGLTGPHLRKFLRKVGRPLPDITNTQTTLPPLPQLPTGVNGPRLSRNRPSTEGDDVRLLPNEIPLGFGGLQGGLQALRMLIESGVQFWLLCFGAWSETLNRLRGARARVLGFVQA